ncbi:LacI family DNA-binding transcriptional regulator [Tessaracoccus terricola]
MTTKPNGSGGRKPTIREVAKAAGVSYATVSRVMNGANWVSPQARSAVEEAIRQTGYKVNAHARSLATGRTDSVAFLLTEEYQLLFADPTFSLLLRDIAEAMAERSVTLVLLVAGSEGERESVERYLSAGHVDGVMLISSHEQDPLLPSLLNHKLPMVACGLPLGHESSVSSVSVDEAGSAAVMTDYLLGRGHRRIAMIAGPDDTPGGHFRLQGFREAMGEQFDPALVVAGDYSRASGRRAMRELLASGNKFDAVFAANDLMAVGAVAELREAGLSVPGDVAVAGFDDSGIAAENDPPLTTMRQPWKELSEQMATVLLDLVGGAELRHVTLPTELVVRESA